MAATARRSGNYTNGNQTPVSGLVCTQFDHCNKFGFEGVVSKRLASALLGRAKPQLGQVEVPTLEAHQLGAISAV